jgi:photosystem II stability/assembly factor-like uncharacterized protein
MKHLFYTLIIGILVFAQSWAQSAPPIIHIAEDAPKWMKMFEQKDLNVSELKKAYEDYYRIHPFEKNSYTQYYKRYMRWVQPYVQSDGVIQIPTPRALQEREDRIREVRETASRNMSSWTMLGPHKTYSTDAATKVTWQTNIYSIDVSESNASILYAGGETGGLWRTDDKGLNWTCKTLGILHNSFTAVKIHPSNPDIVFAATSSRIIRTMDGGANWTTIYTENNLDVREFAYSKSNPNIIVAATNLGVLRTTNNGTHWDKIYTQEAWSIKRAEGNSDKLFLIKKNGTSSDFLYSTDQGLNWSIANTGLWTPPSGESMTGGIIVTCPSNANKLYLYLIGNGGSLNGFVGVYVSNNQGLSWSNTNPSGLVGGTYTIPTHTNLMANNGTNGFNQGFYDMAIVVNPLNENHLIAGGTSWFRSLDGGATWNSLGGYVGSLPWSHPDIQWCVASGSDLYIASDGGINYSNNFGNTHEARMDGISGANLWGFDSGWNTDILVGGRYHNGNMAYMQGFPAGSFYRMGGAEASTGYVNPGPGNKIYHSDIGGHKLIPGWGNGATSFAVGAWPNESYAYYALSEMTFHPNYHNRVYIGYQNMLLVSDDGGASYAVRYIFPGTEDNSVFEICISRSNPNVMYLSQWDGVDDKLWKSINGGQAWTAMTPLPLPNNNDRVKMEVSNTDHNTLWVAVTYGSNGKKIYKSTNGGSSWTNLTTSLLDGIAVEDVMAAYGTNGGVYISTNAGVFYRNNTHSNWQAYSNGLPLSFDTKRIKPFYRDSKVRVGTNSFGVVEAPLFEPSAIQAMPSSSHQVLGCTRDTVYFDDRSVLNHSGATWTWNFPGASYISSSNIRNPKVLYSTAGSYDVTLTITSPGGQTDTRTITQMISVQNLCQVDTVPGRGVTVNGTNGHAVANDANIAATNTMTLTAWVKLNGTQPDYSAIFMSDGPSAAGLNFREGNNTLGYHWPNGAWWWDSNIIVPSDEWAFVAMVIKPTGITVYCNEANATHTFTVPTASFPSFRLGSYRGWSDRNMDGQIDEVAIYNRALSTAEIRELRHLTKKPQLDPSLISYYQFNEIEPSSSSFDNVGIRHLSLLGDAEKAISNAPIGGGSSQRITVNSGGLKDFVNADARLYFKSTGTLPNGDVVVTKINQLPDQSPVTTGLPSAYWIINNYGTNPFTTLDSIRFYRSNNISGGCQLDDYYLYRRATNGHDATWSAAIDSSDYYDYLAVPPFVSFKDNNNVSTAGQYFIQRQGRSNPNAQEICNGLDDDCDGLVDEEYSLTVTSTADSGANTLRAIINCAAAGDTIRFAAGVDTITLLSPISMLKSAVLIDQTGNSVVIRSHLATSGFNNTTYGFMVGADANVSMVNMHFVHTQNSIFKPLMVNQGRLTMNNVKLIGNPKTIIRHSTGAIFNVVNLVEVK